jgi:hypothetical protein
MKRRPDQTVIGVLRILIVVHRMSAGKALVGLAAFEEQQPGRCCIINVLTGVGNYTSVVSWHPAKACNDVHHAIVEVDIHFLMSLSLLDRMLTIRLCAVVFCDIQEFFYDYIFKR